MNLGIRQPSNGSCMEFRSSPMKIIPNDRKDNRKVPGTVPSAFLVKSSSTLANQDYPIEELTTDHLCSFTHHGHD